MQMEGIADFARKENLSLVLLFGSRAQDQSRDDSDLDLALQPCNPDAEPEGIERRLINALKRSDLDLLWLPHASALARARVASTARLLYEDQPSRFRHFVQEAILRQSDSRVWAENDLQFVTRSLERDWKMDRDLVLRKLAQLAEYLEQLEQVMEVDQTTFARDFRIHRVAERQIELLVECAGKLNTEIAQSLAKIPPSDYYSSFFCLAATGWLDDDTAGRLATLAGLRNRLVHQYEDIRLPRLFKACQSSLPDWRAYLTSLTKHLQEHGKQGES